MPQYHILRTCNHSLRHKEEDWKICTQPFRISHKLENKPQFFLLCIISEHTNEKHHNSLRYIYTLRSVRTNSVQHWKKDIVPKISPWELKLGEYIAIAKLTIYIHNRNVVNIRKMIFIYIYTIYRTASKYKHLGAQFLRLYL